MWKSTETVGRHREQNKISRKYREQNKIKHEKNKAKILGEGKGKNMEREKRNVAKARIDNWRQDEKKDEKAQQSAGRNAN